MRELTDYKTIDFKDLNLVHVRPLIIRLLYKILKVLLSSRTHTRCWNFFFLVKKKFQRYKAPDNRTI